MSASARAGSAARPYQAMEWAGAALLFGLLVVLGVHLVGTVFDMVAAVRNPYELDYGEGIVWYQATQIPGPGMYARAEGLPFIVFHYPPVFYLVTRLFAQVMPDPLAAGRTVSALGALAIGPLVCGLVLVAARPSDQRLQARHLIVAVAAGLIALSLHAVRTWGLLMRVDTIGVALGLAGVLVAARSDGRFAGTLAALLLCVGAVYTKQTLLPAGIAVFAVSTLRRPRPALAAAGVAALAGLAVLAWMQWYTSGGFLQNVIGFNINRLALHYAWWVFWPERSSAIFAAMMVFALFYLLLRLWRQRAPGPRLHAVRQLVLIVRLIDKSLAARAMLLLHFGLAGLMLVTAAKSGSNYNYLLDVLTVGCAVLGVFMCELLRKPAAFLAATAFLVLGELDLPYRQLPDRPGAAQVGRMTELTALVREARKPVASEQMTILMRAGKPIWFEPSIVTELASVGRWDEAPLVRMVRSGAFAFMITTNNAVGPTSRRTAAVDAAMREAYPVEEQVGPQLWINRPAVVTRP